MVIVFEMCIKAGKSQLITGKITMICVFQQVQRSKYLWLAVSANF
jgi:hypothetical protein